MGDHYGCHCGPVQRGRARARLPTPNDSTFDRGRGASARDNPGVVIDDYLERTGYASWPRSWDELSVVPQRAWGPFEWPKDAARPAQLVDVEFGAQPGDVAEQTAEDFRAVRPRGSAAYTYIDVGVRPLLDDIRSHTKARTTGESRLRPRLGGSAKKVVKGA